MIGRRFGVWAGLALLAAGCGGGGGSSRNNNNACPEGHESDGPACVPVFDDCPGSAEIPVLGGGCRPVGVTECATGFVSDGEGGCDPVLPSGVCPPGTMAVVGERECRSVGVIECAAGFVSDGEGGCEAVLPQDPCPLGTMEVLGETQCQPIGACGTGKWGDIVTGATTVFVDRSADATSADGSDASPFVTIGDAISVVQPGGQIAVAAGEYTERLLIGKPVDLVGRCAFLVTIRGATVLGQDRPPVSILAGGSGSSVRAVTLAGGAEGMWIDAATGVSVEEVQVAQTGSVGVFLGGEAEAVLRRTVVRESGAVGVFAKGSTLEIDRCVVRDTQPDAAGLFGRGIAAQCDDGSGACGSLTVTSSLVERNRDTGVSIWGVGTAVASSVVRNTLSQDWDQAYGRGISAQCDMDVNACGSLIVAGSLVARNRDSGVLVLGVDAEITSTVVRDTLPEEQRGVFGRGIVMECHPQAGVCGTLTVADSVISGNHHSGVLSWGTDTVVESSIVRDTRAEPNGGTAGIGIETACHPDIRACGPLSVIDSLISGNRDAGIVVVGVDARVVSSAVQNTQATEDGTRGLGIAAQCDGELGICGTLDVTAGLISGNTACGIFVLGADATIVSTVVRDTLEQPADGEVGFGIEAECHSELRTCPSLSVSGSLVVGNTGVGVFGGGAEVVVGSTVVRDTLAEPSDGRFGRGVQATCDPDTGRCGSLTVSDSLVDNNRDVGVVTFGVDARVVSAIVRNAQGQPGDGKFGGGIAAQCFMEGKCGSIHVERSLVSGNRNVGIFVAGADGSVVGTAVRDTLAQLSDRSFGRGINAQCHGPYGACGSLTVADSVVSSSRNVGIFISGVGTTLRSVAVVDVRPNDEGDWAGIYGQGVWALCDEATGVCASLEVGLSRVRSSVSAGLAVQGVTGFVESSVVESVAPRPLDQSFGYGIQLEGQGGLELTSFDVRSCVIRDAWLAGILYLGAGGLVASSSITGGQYTVVANVGSLPELGDDNELSGAVRDGLFWGTMEPSPAPAPALPVEPVAQ